MPGVYAGDVEGQQIKVDENRWFWEWALDLESGVVGWCGGGDPANAVGYIGGFGIGGVIGAGGVGETFVCGEFGDAAVVWGSWAGAA